MKVFIDATEFYPFRTFEEKRSWKLNPEIEISDEDYINYQRAMEQFYYWQSVLAHADPDK